MRGRPIARAAGALLLALLLGACGRQVLYSELGEREANEIVAALYAAGLDVEKIALKGGSFRVDVARSSFSPAITVLQQHGLPRERYESLGEVFDKDGFVSSPLEERARLNYALSQEIARTISNIDGVMVARVHLAAPDRATLLEEAAPASASVFVKHRHDVDLRASVGKIKSMVVTGLENVPYENVTVGLFPAEPPMSFESSRLGAGPEIARASVIPVPLTALQGGALAAALALGLLVALYGRRRGVRSGGARDRSDPLAPAAAALVVPVTGPATRPAAGAVASADAPPRRRAASGPGPARAPVRAASAPVAPGPRPRAARAPRVASPRGPSPRAVGTPRP